MAAVTSAGQILQLGSLPRILQTFQTFLDIPVVMVGVVSSQMFSDIPDHRQSTAGLVKVDNHTAHA